jgi:hypothetical protein
MSLHLQYHKYLDNLIIPLQWSCPLYTSLYVLLNILTNVFFNNFLVCNPVHKNKKYDIQYIEKSYIFYRKSLTKYLYILLYIRKL